MGQTNETCKTAVLMSSEYGATQLQGTFAIEDVCQPGGAQGTPSASLGRHSNLHLQDESSFISFELKGDHRMTQVSLSFPFKTVI